MYTFVFICLGSCTTEHGFSVPNLIREDCVELVERVRKITYSRNVSFCARQADRTPLDMRPEK